MLGPVVKTLADGAKIGLAVGAAVPTAMVTAEVVTKGLNHAGNAIGDNVKAIKGFFNW